MIKWHCPKCGTLLQEAEGDDYWMCEKCSAFFTLFHLELFEKFKGLGNKVRRLKRVNTKLRSMVIEDCCSCQHENLNGKGPYCDCCSFNLNWQLKKSLECKE